MATKVLGNSEIAYSMQQTRHGAIYFPANDSVIGESIREYGEWEHHKLEALTQFIPVGGVVLEIGANVGLSTLALAEKLGPTGQVIAVEPQHQLFQFLTLNIEKNKLAKISALNAAISENEKDFEMCEILQNVRFDSRFIEQKQSDESEVASFSVPCLNIDELPLVKFDLALINSTPLGPNDLMDTISALFTRATTIVINWDLIKDSKSAQKLLNRNHWELRLLRVPLFNRNNILSNPINIYGNSKVNYVVISRLNTKLPDAYSFNFDLIRVADWEDLTRRTESTPGPSNIRVFESDMDLLEERVIALQNHCEDLEFALKSKEYDLDAIKELENIKNELYFLRLLLPKWLLKIARRIKRILRRNV